MVQATDDDNGEEDESESSSDPDDKPKGKAKAKPKGKAKGRPKGKAKAKPKVRKGKPEPGDAEELWENHDNEDADGESGDDEEDSAPCHDEPFTGVKFHKPGACTRKCEPVFHANRYM